VKSIEIENLIEKVMQSKSGQVTLGHRHSTARVSNR